MENINQLRAEVLNLHDAFDIDNMDGTEFTAWIGLFVDKVMEYQITKLAHQNHAKAQQIAKDAGYKIE